MFAVGWGANQFVPLLIVYRHTLKLDDAALASIFGVYAAGLAPGFLLGGPASDRLGRRTLVVAFTALSAAASGVLATGVWSPVGLYAGRLLIGVCSGVVFAVGSSWIKELSDAASGSAATRASITLSSAFAAGPLLAGVLAQWAPFPAVLPYGVQAALALAAVSLALGAPETRPALPHGGRRGMRMAGRERGPFLGATLSVAPWVFVCATIAFAVLPGRLPRVAGGDSPLLSGLLTALALVVGALVQQVARGLAARPNLGLSTGLGTATLGLVLGAAGAATGATPLVVTAIVALGAAYGLLLVTGLAEVVRVANPRALGGMVAWYYAVAYLGIAAPYVIAVLAVPLGYPRVLAGSGAAAGMSLAGNLAYRRRLSARKEVCA